MPCMVINSIAHLCSAVSYGFARLHKIVDIIDILLHLCPAAFSCSADLCLQFLSLSLSFQCLTVCFPKPVHWFKNILPKECS